MNKGKQATLFQSWGQKKKDTNDKKIVKYWYTQKILKALIICF
jgi:hypothetical protein